MANESTVAGYPRAGNRTPSARAHREEHWRRILARQQQSGLTRVEFCRREGVKASALSWWSGELRRRGQVHPRKASVPKARPKRPRRSVFVPVRVIEAAAPASASAMEVVTRGGHIIRLQPGFDSATLRRVVAALEGQPC